LSKKNAVHSEVGSADKYQAGGFAQRPYGQGDAFCWTEWHKNEYGLDVSVPRQEKPLDPQ